MISDGFENLQGNTDDDNLLLDFLHSLYMVVENTAIVGDYLYLNKLFKVHFIDKLELLNEDRILDMDLKILGNTKNLNLNITAPAKILQTKIEEIAGENYYNFKTFITLLIYFLFFWNLWRKVSMNQSINSTANAI